MTSSDFQLAVLGDPVAHSLSPAMHNDALRHCGLKGSYKAIHTPAEELAELVARLQSEGYSGFNVTIPHKQRILPLLQRIDESAGRIGAVNTVVAVYDDQSFDRSVPGRGEGVNDLAMPLAGYNTDASGISRIVTALQFDGERRALVLGAGGAARAVVDALLTLDWKVTVANRTVQRARDAFLGRAGVVGLGALSSVGDFSMIVNATSAGMNAPEESPLPDSISIPRHLTVVELVYSPLETRFVREARAAGSRVIDGLEMLAAQAADSFDLWTGRRLPDSFFQQAAEAGLRGRGDGRNNGETTRLNEYLGSASGSFPSDPYDGSGAAAQ